MVRLKRLKVHRFRHVEPGTELHFGNTFNVLLGKNAVGKTTLLELVNAIANDDFTLFHGEPRGFDLEYELLFVESSVTIQSRLARDPLLAVREGGPEDSRSLTRYIGARFREHGSLSWRQEGKDSWDCRIEARNLAYSSGRVGELAQEPSHGSRDHMCREVFADRVTWFAEWYRDVIASLLERAPRFDEADGFVEAIGAPNVFEVENEGSGRPFFLAARGWPEPIRDSMDEIATPDSNLLELDSSASPLLDEMARRLGFEQVKMSAPLVEKDEDGAHFEKPRFLFAAGERKVSLDLLSFGQRRFFLFLWYLTLRERLPLVVDELVNGFHHEWIEQCVERLRGRQSFLATQNPLLLDVLPVLGRDEPATTFIRCEGSGDQLSWRAFAPDEADRVAKAREVGIQSISETLRFEGLW
jgi:hypothetical protein